MSVNKTAVEKRKKNTTIFYKRKTSELWEASDYVAKSNEILIATDTGVCKYGDGVHVWRELEEIKEENNDE